MQNVNLYSQEKPASAGPGRRQMLALAAAALTLLGCHNVTLNVWECNPGARAFYDTMGMTPLKTCLEQVL